MIGAPQGWRTFRGQRELCFVHPVDLAHGIITYDEGQRPLASMPELVARELRARSSFVASAVGEAELLATDEGEHAALVRVAGTFNGRPAELAIGLVLFDEQYSRIVGLCVEGTLLDVVRDLVRSDAYLLGPRPRRAHYARPPGWHAVARGLLTELYPPEAPRDRAVLTVWPALPRARARDAWQRAVFQLERGFSVERELTRELVTAQKLEGHRYRLAGDVTQRDVVVLRDATYVYPFRLEVVQGSPRAAEHAEVLMRMVDSCRPLPGRRATPVAHAALDHWVL